MEQQCGQINHPVADLHTSATMRCNASNIAAQFGWRQIFSKTDKILLFVFLHITRLASRNVELRSKLGCNWLFSSTISFTGTASCPLLFGFFQAIPDLQMLLMRILDLEFFCGCVLCLYTSHPKHTVFVFWGEILNTLLSLLSLSLSLFEVRSWARRCCCRCHCHCLRWDPHFPFAAHVATAPPAAARCRLLLNNHQPSQSENHHLEWKRQISFVQGRVSAGDNENYPENAHDNIL